MGLVQAVGDPCLYTASEGEMFLIAVYVDDIIVSYEGHSISTIAIKSFTYTCNNYTV